MCPTDDSKASGSGGTWVGPPFVILSLRRACPGRNPTERGGSPLGTVVSFRSQPRIGERSFAPLRMTMGFTITKGAVAFANSPGYPVASIGGGPPQALQNPRPAYWAAV